MELRDGILVRMDRGQIRDRMLVRPVCRSGKGQNVCEACMHGACMYGTECKCGWREVKGRMEVWLEGGKGQNGSVVVGR